MIVRRTLYILLFVFLCPLALVGQDVSVLHCNLFSNGAFSGIRYKAEKEVAILDLLSSKGASVYSVLEDGDPELFAANKAFSPFGNYELKHLRAFDLRHSLLFDKEKVSILKSEVVDFSSKHIFYYKLQLKGVLEPLHVVVYKRNADYQERKLYEGIFTFLQKENATQNVILLGGGVVPAWKSRESLNAEFCKTYRLVNPNTATYLFDRDCKINEQDDIDFVFYSKDLGIAAKTSELKYARVEKMQCFCTTEVYKALENVTDNKPISFRLQKRGAAKANFYKTPQLEIVSQNKSSLECSLVWDKDTKLSIEAVSIIGSVFFSDNFDYEGKEKELKIDVTDFPTGIYLLKVIGAEGRIVVRKFTKY